MPDDTYEVYGLLYGSLARMRRQALLGADPDDHTPMPVGYYIWVIRNAARTIVVDTGFEKAEGLRRGRSMAISPQDGLALLGVDCEQVSDVILTHLHFDHAGNLDIFPNARIHLQETEMAFATGRAMGYAELRRAYSFADIATAVRCVFDGRMVFADGDKQIFPGLSIHLIGGHSKGLQCVRVQTGRGTLILASDTAHYYENLATYQPFVVQQNVEATLRGYDRLKDLAGPDGTIVPGHDLLLMERYPAPDDSLSGIAVRLDIAETCPAGVKPE